METILYIISSVIFILLLWITLGAREIAVRKKNLNVHLNYIIAMLSKRQNMIPVLITLLKRNFITETFTDLINARENAIKEKCLSDRKIETENVLTENLNKIFDLFGSHKDLQKSGYFLEIRSELKNLDNKLESEVNKFNKMVNDYNGIIENPFYILCVSILRYKRQNLFEIKI
jgi:hypothetical protein